MLRSNRQIIPVLLVSSLIAGAVIAHFGIGGILFGVGLSIGILLVFALAFLFDSLKKTDFQTIPLFLFYTLFLGTFLSLPLMYVKYHFQHYEAQTVIEKIDSFKNTYGYFPQTIEQAGATNIYTTVEYELNLNSNYYKIQYDMNGLTSEYYFSDKKYWSVYFSDIGGWTF